MKKDYLSDAYDETGSLTLGGVEALQALTSSRLVTLNPGSMEAAYLGDIALALHDLHECKRTAGAAAEKPAEALTLSDLRKSLDVIARSVADAQAAVEAKTDKPEPLTIADM